MAADPVTSPDTPMIRQYLRIKSQHRDAILFYRMGDFYEMFFDDAVVAARVLNIALTSRDKDKANPVPLCGIPYHSAENYIARLVREGHRVAICEQIGETGGKTKLVRREVVRVITPGTILSEGYLSGKRNNFLAAVLPSQAGTGLAFLDISTGDFVGLEVEAGRDEDLLGRLADFEPSEVVVPEASGQNIARLFDRTGLPRPGLPRLDDVHFETGRAREALLAHFGTLTLEPFGLTGENPLVAAAAGAVLAYALETQKTGLGHVRRFTLLEPGGHLRMDAATQRNLELVRSAAHGGREGTLIETLDETLTPMGGRLLRQWILRPLTGVEAIVARLDGVAELIDRVDLAEALRLKLREVLDLERLTGRLTLGAGGPRDLLSLRNSLLPLPALREALDSLSSPVLRDIVDRLDPLDDLARLLGEAVRDDAPVSSRDGGFIRRGFDGDLDRWLAVSTEGGRFISELEARERARTGIASLKIRYNRVFGYYLEVTKANLKDVPGDYVRKQTLVNAERFTCPELAEHESKVLEADERVLARELELFATLRRSVVDRVERIRRTTAAVAALDVLAGLARRAVTGDYCRPEVDASDVLDIRDGRHPVVERLSTDEPFIPNDCLLNTTDRQMAVITGPNMAGKSTYLRQTALIVLMAQVGSFVPARRARIGVVDRIFTRVGATDYLVRGQSTFMVEMTETALILHNATPRSLVILDEIGRGTSTFDGLSIAWAVAEYLHDAPDHKARTLFATHYHQLTELALTLPGVINLSTQVREWGDRIIFLRKVAEGGSDRSYGIQVARLAGLPLPVIDRAREIMANLEAGELDTAGMPKLADHAGAAGHPSQLYLFGAAGDAVLETLRLAVPETMTPLEALALLDSLVKRLRHGSA
jgi:DNA mismatch repair protein MutS